MKVGLKGITVFVEVKLGQITATWTELIMYNNIM
jgi:hypothetical protein